jgi:tetratricopeptide (TPR) repeat protein
MFSTSVSFFYFSQKKSVSPVLAEQLESPTSSSYPTSQQPQSTAVSSLPDPPTAKTLTGGKQVFQTFNNCGPASLSIALSFYGKSVSQQELGQALRPYQNAQGKDDDKSVTLDELAAQAQKYDLITYHRPAGNMQLIKQFIANDIPVVTRTWLKKDDDIGHYRVIIGYNEDKQQIIQDDSMQGANLAFSYEDYGQLWEAFNYEYLIVAPKDKQEIVEAILTEDLEETHAWQIAVTLSDAALQKNQSDIYAEFNKSVALYHLGEDEAAIRSFEKVESRLPARMLWYQLEPLLAYYHLGEDQKVMSISEQIFNDRNPSYSELHYLRSKIFQKQGNAAAAEEELKKAEKFNVGETWKVNVKGVE